MVLCRDYQFSTRRACGLIGFSRSSNEYRGRPDRHARIRERLVTLSGKHRRYGYRMLHAKLGQEGFKVNVKVVERLYREERLTLRRRNRKKNPQGRARRRLVPDRRQPAVEPGLHHGCARQRQEVPHRQSERRLHTGMSGD